VVWNSPHLSPICTFLSSYRFIMEELALFYILLTHREGFHDEEPRSCGPIPSLFLSYPLRFSSTPKRSTRRTQSLHSSGARDSTVRFVFCHAMILTCYENVPPEKWSPLFYKSSTTNGNLCSHGQQTIIACVWKPYICFKFRY
jgi:hypothetical protein